MEFQDAKKELLQLAKNAGAYCEQYKLAIKSETPAELISVIKNDAYWCVTNKANPSGVVGSE